MLGRAKSASLRSVLSGTRTLPSGDASNLLEEEAALSTAHLHAVPPPTDFVELFSEAPLPTRHGLFRVMVFRERGTDKEHVVAVKGDPGDHEGVPVRVHSECLTSEILGSLKCDCREQPERTSAAACALGERCSAAPTSATPQQAATA